MTGNSATYLCRSSAFETPAINRGFVFPTVVDRFDGALAEAAREVEGNALLEPAGQGFEIGLAGRRIQDAYEVCDGEASGAIPGFHSVSGKLRRTILGEPDVWYRG